MWIKTEKPSNPILEFKLSSVTLKCKFILYTQIFTHTHIYSLACKHNHITLHMEMIFLYLT